MPPQLPMMSSQNFSRSERFFQHLKQCQPSKEDKIKEEGEEREDQMEKEEGIMIEKI